MRHGCLYWVLIGWWWGVLRLALLACIGVICTFLALPVWLLAEAVKRARNGIWGLRGHPAEVGRPAARQGGNRSMHLERIDDD